MNKISKTIIKKHISNDSINLKPHQNFAVLIRKKVEHQRRRSYPSLSIMNEKNVRTHNTIFVQEKNKYLRFIHLFFNDFPSRYPSPVLSSKLPNGRKWVTDIQYKHNPPPWPRPIVSLICESSVCGSVYIYKLTSRVLWDTPKINIFYYLYVYAILMLFCIFSGMFVKFCCDISSG